MKYNQFRFPFAISTDSSTVDVLAMSTKAAAMSASVKPMPSPLPIDSRGGDLAIPTLAFPQNVAARLKNLAIQDVYTPVNQNGSFEFDRVLKSGYVHKRTQKTKVSGG